jgi:hypothetical protein
MKVVLFGATGMIGQAVLRECLTDRDVTAVLSIGRRPSGAQHAKLRDIVHDDLIDVGAIEAQLAGYDACLFCLGSTSVGMTEAEYTRVTYDVAMAAATALSRQSPGMTFVFISGRGTDASEQGKTMWARVKGKTENAIARLPFKATYMFRPGYIQPVHGEKSRTAWTRNTYLLAGWLYPLWKLLFPNYVSTTEGLARAMLAVAKRGADKHVLEVRDINRVASAVQVHDGSLQPGHDPLSLNRVADEMEAEVFADKHKAK